MRIDVDARDAFRAAADLAGFADELAGAVKPVVAKAAVNVKATMQDDMRESAHFRQVATRISYDIRAGQGWAEAQIGPNTEGATVGDLAHFAYFGGANGGGGTVRDPLDAAMEEAPAFEKYMAALVGVWR
jgi:hypothetical protein